MVGNVRWTHLALQDVGVAVADTAGVDFEQDLAGFDFGHGKLLDLERLVGAGNDGRLVGLGQ